MCIEVNNREQNYLKTLFILTSTVADLEGGVRGVRPPKIRKAYVIQR